MSEANQITLDNKTPRYYTDIVYSVVMDEVEKTCMIADGAYDKIRVGKQFSVKDLKKGTVQRCYRHYDFGWLSPDLAIEVSKKLNKRGYNTIILREQGGIGISGIHTVILVEEVD